MVTYTIITIESDYEVFVSPAHSPEKHMLSALLERSWRDLCNNVSIYETRQAISWFEDTGKNALRYADQHISFQQVADELQLSAGRLKAIWERVGVAKEFLENYSKDKKCVDTRHPPTSIRTRVNKSVQKREASRESRCAMVA